MPIWIMLGRLNIRNRSFLSWEGGEGGGGGEAGEIRDLASR